MGRWGDLRQAQSLTDEGERKLPQNINPQATRLPTIRAAIELRRGNPAKAIELLQASSRYEPTLYPFWPTWLPGQAYLQLRQGARAAAEFQRIIEHRGWDPLSPLWSLAHLGMARAAAMQGDAANSRQAYEAFLALWQGADADLPILIEARKESEKLR
jgi:predicted Zn-dependent protease